MEISGRDGMSSKNSGRDGTGRKKKFGTGRDGMSLKFSGRDEILKFVSVPGRPGRPVCEP